MMFRKRKYVIVSLLLIIWGGNVCAQANSDYKTVAKKKIKTATAFSVRGDNDTTWVRYNYDAEGRLRETNWNSSNVHHTKCLYDVNGKMTDRYYWVVTQRAKKSQDGVWHWLPDTSFREIVKYDVQTNKEIYNLHLEYSNNIPHTGRLDIQSGDTSFHYDFRYGRFNLQSMEIKAKVDSLKRGFALISYGVIYRDTTFSSASCDTSLYGCNVTVQNRKGQTIRTYGLFYDYQKLDSTYTPPGQLFSPLNRKDMVIGKVVRYKTTMIKEGDFMVEKITDRETGKSFTGKHTYIGPAMNSLEEIKTHGDVSYEYY